MPVGRGVYMKTLAWIGITILAVMALSLVSWSLNRTPGTEAPLSTPTLTVATVNQLVMNPLLPNLPQHVRQFNHGRHTICPKKRVRLAEGGWGWLGGPVWLEDLSPDNAPMTERVWLVRLGICKLGLVDSTGRIIVP